MQLAPLLISTKRGVRPGTMDLIDPSEQNNIEPVRGVAGTVVQSTRQKILEFKQKVLWRLCTDLLDPPLPPVERLRLPADMSDYDRQEAKRRHADILLNRELALKRREPELLGRLEDIMLRIIQSRTERVVDNNEVWAAPKAEQQGLEFECDVCGNKDQRCYLRDGATGDTICLGANKSGCGNVVQDHRVDEGSQFRTFADDDGKDRNHHGPTPDPLMPDSENMKTSLLGAGAAFKKLNQANQYVEMNLSNIGSDDRRTRTSYRNQHKRNAFQLMEDAAEQLGIHDSVIARAKEEFARFRDVREHVISYHGVVAACLAIAFEELILSNQLPASWKTEIEKNPPTSAWVKLADQSIDARKSIEKAALDNPVLNTLSNKSLKSFSLSELEIWLRVVFPSASSIDGAAKTIEIIKKTLSSAGSVREQRASGISQGALAILANARKRSISDTAPSWMGSTTTANRAKKSKNGHGGYEGFKNSLNAVTSINPTEVGNVFLRLDFDSIIDDAAAVAVLRTSIKARLKFEAWAANKMAERELEEKRLLQEKTDFRMYDVIDKTGENKMRKPIEGITVVAASTEDEMLREMMNSKGNTADNEQDIAEASNAAFKKIAGPKIRMSVDSRGYNASPDISSTVAVKATTASGERETPDSVGKKDNYFYENGKRMRMVQRVRTDGRSGKQIVVVIKEEVPSDWESDEDDES